MLAEALVERVLGEGVQVLDRFPGAALDGVRYEPPFPFLPAQRVRRARAHRAARGLRLRRGRHGPRAHRDRLRRGRLPARRALRPERRQPRAARRHVRRAHRQVRRPLRQGRRPRPHRGPRAPRPHAARRGARALLPALLALAATRSSTTRSRRGTSRRRRCATASSAANEEVNWHPEHIKHGRFGDWLAGNVDWALSRERYWGTPLPVWRDEDGNVTVIGSFAELEELSGREARRPAPPVRRRRHVPEPGVGQDARAASPRSSTCGSTPGSMPFAQWHAPFEHEEEFDEQFPADFICEAIDQTRGWFYSLHAISVLLLRPAVVPQRRLPRPDPRRRGPEDVEVQGQHRRALGRHRALRRRRVPLVLLHVQAAVGRLPLLDGRDRRGRAALPAPAVERLRVLRALRAVRGAVRRRGDRPRPLDPLAGRRDGRGGHRAAGRLRRDVRRPRDRRARRRPLQLVRPALAAALLGRRRDARCGRCARRSSRSRSCSRRSRRSSPTRSTRTSTAPSRPCTSPTGPSRPSATSSLERDMARRARGGDARPARARRGEGQAAPAAARGGRRRRGRRARRDRAARRRRARRAQREGAAHGRARPTSSATSSSSPTTARSARGSASRCRRSPPRSPALDAARAAAALREGAPGRRAPSTATTTSSRADDLLVSLAPLEGYQLEREGSHAVALELALDEGLRREGLAQEIVHAIQNARKATGLAVEDRIALTLGGDEDLLDVARAFEAHVAGETLAVEVVYDGDGVGRGGAHRGPRAAHRGRAPDRQRPQVRVPAPQRCGCATGEPADDPSDECPIGWESSVHGRSRPLPRSPDLARAPGDRAPARDPRGVPRRRRRRPRRRRRAAAGVRGRAAPRARRRSALGHRGGRRSSSPPSPATSRCSGSSPGAPPRGSACARAPRSRSAARASRACCPTAGVGGAALTLWALRRSGMATPRAARTLFAFLVMLYSVFLVGDRALRRAASRPGSSSRRRPRGRRRDARGARRARDRRRPRGSAGARDAADRALRSGRIGALLERRAARRRRRPRRLRDAPPPGSARCSGALAWWTFDAARAVGDAPRVRRAALDSPSSRSRTSSARPATRCRSRAP